jgi:hypothetical protein
MVLKIGKDLEYKLGYIAKTKEIKKTELIDKVFQAFIKRYETKFNPIKIPKREKKDTDNWRMYELFKQYYFKTHGKEYEVTPKNLPIDLRHIKKVKEKLVDLIVNKETENIVAVDEDDLVNSFEYILVKMPDWWKQNSFLPSSICKNLNKILEQIKNGKQNGKDALDNFISSL